MQAQLSGTLKGAFTRSPGPRQEPQREDPDPEKPGENLTVPWMSDSTSPITKQTTGSINRSHPCFSS